jgi:hypothetical protein
LKKAESNLVLPFSFFSRKKLLQRKVFVLLQPQSKGILAKKEQINRYRDEAHLSTFEQKT